MSAEEPPKKRRNRWGQSAAADEGATPAPAAPPKAPLAQFDLGATAAAAKEAMEKAKLARDRQNAIQAQMAAQGLTQAPAGGPRKLVLDEFGREVDERGQVVPMKKANVSTLQVNSKSASAKKQPGQPSKSFIDPYLRVKKDDKKQEAFQRKRRFNFNEDDTGKWARRAEETEKKKIELKKEQEYKDKKAGTKKEEPSTDNPNLMPLGEGAAPKVKFVRPDPPPECEWWDQVLVRDVVPGKDWILDPGKITLYVEHPVPQRVKEKEVKQDTMFLTQKERKKLRRLRRQQKNKEMQDKIKMGLVAPPPPKVKMSNLMRVLGDAQVANPSAIENKVKDGMLQRKEGHEKRNEERKLAPEERKKKKVDKWSTDDNVTVYVQVYKIKDLSSKKNQFKIDQNAQQFHMTGTMLTGEKLGNLVVVEGIQRSAKRFKRLMMHRMKWDEFAEQEDSDSDDDGAGDAKDHCVLLWEGEVKERAFPDWKVQEFKSNEEALKLLKERGGEEYWNIYNQYRAISLDVGL